MLVCDLYTENEENNLDLEETQLNRQIHFTTKFSSTKKLPIHVSTVFDSRSADKIVQKYKDFRPYYDPSKVNSRALAL